MVLQINFNSTVSKFVWNFKLNEMRQKTGSIRFNPTDEEQYATKIIHAEANAMDDEIQTSQITTSNGLALKNTDRVDIIKSRFSYEFTMNALSWQISRYVRRDFNIMSSYIFSQCHRKNPNRSRINEFLLELHLQAEELSAKSKIFEDIDSSANTEIPIKIVSAETALLYKAMKIADEAMARLNTAHKAGSLTVDRRENMANDFQTTFCGLRQFLFTISKKTASELGQEIGIS